MSAARTATTNLADLQAPHPLDFRFGIGRVLDEGLVEDEIGSRQPGNQHQESMERNQKDREEKQAYVPRFRRRQDRLNEPPAWRCDEDVRLCLRAVSKVSRGPGKETGKGGVLPVGSHVSRQQILPDGYELSLPCRVSRRCSGSTPSCARKCPGDPYSGL